MNEEQTTKLIEMVQDYMEIQYTTLAMSITLTLVLLAWIGFGIYKLYKMKKYRKEWVKTLNDEQLKTLKDEKKYNV